MFIENPVIDIYFTVTLTYNICFHVPKVIELYFLVQYWYLQINSFDISIDLLKT